MFTQAPGTTTAGPSSLVLEPNLKPDAGPDGRTFAEALQGQLQTGLPPSYGHASDFFTGSGIRIVAIKCPGITAKSDVVASICQVVPWPLPGHGTPFIGEVTMSVLNTAPTDLFSGQAWVKVNIQSERPMPFKVMVVYSK